jgi:hypothetical protein
VIRHEFGHALGLGHYISDDNNINLKWARGEATAPSIMVIFSHEVASENKIHPIDIEKVISLYGPDGFLGDQPKPFMGFEFKRQDCQRQVSNKLRHNCWQCNKGAL